MIVAGLTGVSEAGRAPGASTGTGDVPGGEDASCAPRTRRFSSSGILRNHYQVRNDFDS